ncbi:hypothetical protein [Gillisia sp. Hel_I_29]|uniref:hypothetical protein n=1 Tax=Gillisia sp. Hel_I_29 TaxID=1249975 RepID=UPI00054EBA98|nr:hypothetical protein [Gillisia sp. Hel_I_29]
MRKSEINLTEEQYQHIVEERSYGSRTNLAGETFGGYEICLHVRCLEVFLATLEIKMINTIDLGEVEWEIIELS